MLLRLGWRLLQLRWGLRHWLMLLRHLRWHGLMHLGWLLDRRLRLLLLG